MTALKMGGFFVYFAQFCMVLSTKLWKGVILTNPNQSVTMNTEAIRKPQKNEKENKTRPRRKMRKNERHTHHNK